MKKTLYLLHLIALTILFTPSLKAQKLDLRQSLQNDPSVIRKTLPNGFTYYIKKNQEPKKRAVLYLVEKAGSTSENDQQQGLAHFLEHMAFNGTKSFPKNELISYLQKSGVKFGADLNAYTSFNETVYQLPVPTDSVATFKKSFEILADWAGGLLLETAEINKERGVIIEEERQSGKNAQERMNKQLFPVLFYKSKYAERIPIGKTAVVQNFKPETLKNFYKTWYRPNLQSVIAVGDFDVAEVEKLIIKNFSNLKNPAKEIPLKKYDFVPNKQPIVKIITDPEQAYNIAMIFFKKFGNKPVTTIGDLKLNYCYSMINSMISARIQDLIQSGKAPYLFAQIGYQDYQGGIDPKVKALQVVLASKEATGLPKALNAVLAELHSAVKFGFTPSELDVVKKNNLVMVENGYKERDKITSANYVNNYVQHFLNNEYYIAPENDYQWSKEIINTISLEEINKIALGLLDQTNETVIVQAPEKEKANLPTDAKILEILKNAGKNVSAYKETNIDKALLDSLPQGGKIVKIDSIPDLKIKKLTLSNGINVYLKATNFKNDEILIQSFQTGGTSNFDDFIAASNIPTVISSGIGQFNQADLRKVLAGKNASVSPYLTSLYQGFSGSSTTKDFETALQMMYAYVLHPRRDTAYFNKNLSDEKVFIKNKYVNPLGVFQDTIGKFLANNNPRLMPTTLDDLAKANLDHSIALYKKSFDNMNDMNFILVGNIDDKTCYPLIEKYIASLPTDTTKHKNYVDRGSDLPQGVFTKKVYKGLEDKVQALIILHDSFEYNSHNNLLLSALNEGLQNKILERLREKESGVYTPSTSITQTNLPKSRYTINIQFSCATENVAKLLDATNEELDLIQKNGISKDDFDKFKAEAIRSYELNLRQNSFWVSAIESKLKNKEPLESLLTFKARLDALSLDEVKEAAKRYLKPKNKDVFVLYPEKKKAK